MEFRVIKAHDGLRVGDIKVLDAGHPVADYMVERGYWEPVKPAPQPEPATVETKPAKKTKRR